MSDLSSIANLLGDAYDSGYHHAIDDIQSVFRRACHGPESSPEHVKEFLGIIEQLDRMRYKTREELP